MPAEKEECNPYEFGETMLPEGIENVHPRYAISWRNKWMVNEADVVIAYVTHTWGGAARYMEMAAKNHDEVYIREHHETLMAEYHQMVQSIADIFDLAKNCSEQAVEGAGTIISQEDFQQKVEGGEAG